MSFSPSASAPYSRPARATSSGDLFPARAPKPLPSADILAFYGIGTDDFAAHHEVVTCPVCETETGRRVFLMLRYIVRDGETTRAVGFFPRAKGKGAGGGTTRWMWVHAVGLGVTCDEGHCVRLDPVTGEVLTR